MILDLTEIYSKPGTSFLNSFKNTFMVGIRNREANSSSVHNMYVRAFDVEDALAIADEVVKPFDMIVKDVIRPGDEIFGLVEGDADPLPLLRDGTLHKNIYEF